MDRTPFQNFAGTTRARCPGTILVIAPNTAPGVDDTHDWPVRCDPATTGMRVATAAGGPARARARITRAVQQPG